MRLSPAYRREIVDAVSRQDSDAVVYLFGSRVDDSKRGGDIDLLILSERITPAMKRKLKLRLYDRFGEQKIDLVVAADRSRAFTRIAMREGVKL